MKTASFGNLVVLVVAMLSFVSCRRHKPRHDEIERVINDTHSSIWKCSECPFGSGLSVLCGTSVPLNVSIECEPCVLGVSYSDTHDYSSCKPCKSCSDHEKRSGQCTQEEDTTRCLKTCDKGYYWEDVIDSCLPCDYCCGKNITQVEKQCEDSGLPVVHQCRQTGVICPHPTVNSSHDKNTHHGDELSSDRPRRRTLSSSEIVGIVFGLILGILVLGGIIVAAVMWKMFGWQETKTRLKNCCCNCCGLLNFTSGNTINFNDVCGESAFPRSATQTETHVEDIEDKLGSLNSALPVSRRPAFLRMCSFPAENNFKVKPAPTSISRSRSHPGCLMNMINEPTGNKPDFPKKCIGDRRTKKVGKKKYVSVATTDEDCSDLGYQAEAGPEILVTGTDEVLPSKNPAPKRDEQCGKLCPPSPAAKTQYTSTTGLHHSSRYNLESVPQDFQEDLLRLKLSAIKLEFYRPICIKLDKVRECFWDDYRLLGEKIGLTKDEVAWLGQNSNPTRSMIQKFDSKKNSSIGKFRSILEEMERDDVVSVINEWIVSEWIATCSSSLAVLV